MTATLETRTVLEPTGDRLIVRRISAQETTEGGIVLPDNAREKPCEGVVKAVGPGVDGTYRQMPAKAGDRVLFSKYAGTEAKHDGEDVLILRADDVLARVREVGA